MVTIDSARILRLMDSTYGVENPLTYYYFGQQTPIRDAWLNYYNSKQRADGSWLDTHGYPIVAQTFIQGCYMILNSRPLKSLDPWFKAECSNWNHIVSDVYQYASGNPWGTLFAYPMIWLGYYKRIPPWINDYWALAKAEKASWINNIHQRDHFIVPYLALQKEPPYLEELLQRTLSEQSNDGAWVNDVHESGIALHNIIVPYYLLTGRQDLFNAIEKAKPFIESCYREATVNGKDIAWFVTNPLVDSDPSNIDIVDTFFGTMGAIDTGLIQGWTDPFYTNYRPSYDLLPIFFLGSIALLLLLE